MLKKKKSNFKKAFHNLWNTISTKYMNTLIIILICCVVALCIMTIPKKEVPSKLVVEDMIGIAKGNDDHKK